jgi:UDP-glucose 4-epimerase
VTTRIVITGATGFIGTALCKKLEKLKEYSIVKVTRSKDKSGFYNVKSYQQSPIGDILIHLGENPDRGIVNKKGDLYRKETGKVIESLLGKNYKKVIYCSTSAIYGDKGTEPYSENMETCANDIYTKAKIENEKRVLSAGGIVVRFSNVIGPGMSKNNVLSDIIKQLLNTEILEIQNIKPIRDFIWIDDVVDAVTQLIKTEISGIFNIGSGVAISINQLAEIVLNIAGQSERNTKINSTIINAEYSYNVLNIEKIKKVTNWKPMVTLPQSVQNMVNNL